MEQGPIFIGGLDRCGKTMMQAFLTSHPNISIPAVGSNMWTFFYGQHGDLSQPANFERCLAAMLNYKHVRFLQPDADRVRREFWQGQPTYARLFALFQQHYAERAGKPRWGDQSGLIESYADLIFEAYPDAKMIHMMRDPRDRYEASLVAWEKGQGRAGGATARWLYSVKLARHNLSRYPDRYKVVRYETLVAQPAETLREVCVFLGEEYSPAMLAMESASGYREKLSQGANGKSGQTLVSTDYIGRFRTGVPKREIAFMQAHAGRDMAAYNYEVEPLNFSPNDHLLFYLVDWPSNLVRMIAWQTKETIQHKFPSLLGHTPTAHKIK
jgi:hypothetical protein